MPYKYKKIRISKTEVRDEHRLVMEEFLGRRLGRKEIVHHKDGNKLNNDLSNLEVMLLSDHSRMHGKERIMTQAQLDNFKKGRGLLKKLTREGIEEIKILLEKGVSYRSIAKIYGVSSSTIYKINKTQKLAFWGRTVAIPFDRENAQ